MILGLLRRVLATIATLAAVSLVLFALTRAIPVSPARVVLGFDATEEDVADWEKEHGLDQPWHAQYLRWAANAARGEFGRSVIDEGSITRTVAQTLPVTLELVCWGFLLALGLALPLGVLSALYEGRWVDQAVRMVAVLGVSVPGFWLGLMLIAWGAVRLGWFPPGGWTPWRDGAGAHLRGVVLPALSLGLYYVAVISRMTRATVSDQLGAEWVRVARAMGLPRRRILLGALKNAAPPVVTVAAMSFGYMFGWALIVEQVFNVPGMSRALLSAIFKRDYDVIQAVVLVITALFLAANLLADLLYRVLDPRLGAAEG